MRILLFGGKCALLSPVVLLGCNLHAGRLSTHGFRKLKAPFSHPDWLFELKYDGFRALAHIARDGACATTPAGVLGTLLGDSVGRSHPNP
jgi:hypothetical protein